MKVEVLQENIASGLSLANRIASSKTTLPILTNTLLETDSGRLKLVATNLEVSLEYWVGGKVEHDGRTTVTTGLFHNYLQNLSPEKIVLEEKDNKLQVTGATSQAEFVTMPATDFPVLPQVTEESLLQLSPVKLQSLLKKILFAAATSEARPVLTGVLFRGTPDGLIMVATDGFRLAEVTVEWATLRAEPPQEAFELIIPAKMLKEIGQFSGHVNVDEPWGLSLTTDKNQVVFTSDTLRLYARLLEAEFPQYEGIILQEWQTKVEFDRDALAQAVRTAALFAHAHSHTIQFHIKKETNTITVLAESSELGRQETSLPVHVEGNSLETAFNAHYVLDALSAFDGEQAQLQMGAPDKAALFIPVQSEGPDSLRQVVMPVRLERSAS